MDEVQDMLRTIFHTTNELTLAVSGTGSAGMEACVVNLLEPGDKMVVCTNGVFGGRMADVAGRIGAEVVQIHRPFGEVFSVEEVIDVLQKENPKYWGSCMRKLRPVQRSRSKRFLRSFTKPVHCCS